MEPAQELPDIVTQPPEAPTEAQAPLEPTESVKTFWERLDEVLTLNLQAAQMRDRVEALVEEFPTSIGRQTNQSSFLFQPERLIISSNDDQVLYRAITGTGLVSAGGHTPGETFSEFVVRLSRTLIGVKSIQLLSCVIPNIATSLPDYQTGFFFYRLRSLANSQLGAWDPNILYEIGDIVTSGTDTYVCQFPIVNAIPGRQYWSPTGYTETYTVAGVVYPVQEWDASIAYPFVNAAQRAVVLYRGFYYILTQTAPAGIVPTNLNWVQISLPGNLDIPNYYDLNPTKINSIYIQPTSGYPSEYLPPGGNNQIINRTFTNYADLLTTLNACANDAFCCDGPAGAGAVTFQFDALQKRIQMVPDPTQVAANYYFVPCGYEDPNIQTYVSTILTTPYLPSLFQVINGYSYILNTRLGFTWNGVFPSPFQVNPYSPLTTPNAVSNVLYWFLRPRDPQFSLTGLPTPQNVLTASSYGDLVRTSCVKVFANFIFGSTEDSKRGQGGILSLVPVNAASLGVGFYQNNFNRPLTKIPSNITEIGIRLEDDQGIPFLLPNSATVLLELSVEYN